MITPSYMLAIADEFARQGLDPTQCSLRVSIFGAEPWTDAMRATIQKRLSLSAVDIYGLSEVMGPGVANECHETKDGPTIWEDHFYPEIIDPQSGAVLPDGEFGELVFTSLTKDALMVVRYRTRDLTRLLPGNAGTMRRMAKITGRTDDMLIIRGVNVFPTQIEELLLKQEKLSSHYQLVVEKYAHLDALSVSVEMRPELANENQTEQQLAARALEQAIKSYVGVSASVIVQPQGGIERSMEKAKRVIDMRLTA